MSENSEQKCVIYFQPGQLMFHAHGNLKSSPDAIQSLVNWANGIAESRGIQVAASGNVFDFDPAPPPVFYLKSAMAARNVKTKPAWDQSLKEISPEQQHPSYASPQPRVPPPFSLVFANATSDRWSSTPTEAQIAQASKELLDLILELDEKRATAPVNLEVVGPNWLMGSGPEPGGTGGPGGKPYPVKNTDTHKHRINPRPYRDPASSPSSAAALPPTFADVSTPLGGSDVVVAILDTSYPTDQLESIYKAWVSEIPTDRTPHPIVDALLGPGGCLTIHDDPAVDGYFTDTVIPGHDYDMTDHGLFVAGIINSIAPKAELHLYKVLDKHGLGDLRSIANALEDIKNNLGGRNLVINLSLTMTLPLEEKHLHPQDVYGLGQAILRQKPWWLARLIARFFNWIVGKPMLCTCDSWYERQARAFEWICDLVYALDSRVIAAAGNNGKPGQSRPWATYPAAFERVFGVGALRKDPSTASRVTPASYSNLADMPPRSGITTFGGESGEGNGVLGVYIGPFPNDDRGRPQPNNNGWAWWSGTSFATPIISGMAAAVLGNLIRNNPGRSFRTEDAIQELYRMEMRQTPTWNEDVFGVEQW